MKIDIVVLLIMFIGSICFGVGLNIGIKKILSEAVENRAGVWKIDEKTGKKYFWWVIPASTNKPYQVKEEY